jgi:hypothetical protein
MDQDQSSLFGMGIDPTSKLHLAEAARWAKFLAVIGFIMCAFIILFGILAATGIGVFTSMYGNRYDGGQDVNVAGLGAAMAAMYIIFTAVAAVIYFFPYLFLFRFANHMKSALASNDQNALNTSFQNLKKLFRYVGILTIIGLAFCLIGFLIAIVSMGSMR